MSRIDPIMKNLIGNENPDDLAQDILEVLDMVKMLVLVL